LHNVTFVEFEFVSHVLEFNFALALIDDLLLEAIAVIFTNDLDACLRFEDELVSSDRIWRACILDRVRIRPGDEELGVDLANLGRLRRRWARGQLDTVGRGAGPAAVIAMHFEAVCVAGLEVLNLVTGAGPRLF